MHMYVMVMFSLNVNLFSWNKHLITLDKSVTNITLNVFHAFVGLVNNDLDALIDIYTLIKIHI